MEGLTEEGMSPGLYESSIVIGVSKIESEEVAVSRASKLYE